jgi:methylated-DNA-[protein]-cysteine S-methyltransferase
MDTGIFARHSPYLDRHVQVGVASERVISVAFPEEPDDGAEEDHELLDRIEAYLEGVEDDFRDVEVGMTVSGDERAVLEAVREVPYGEQVTVEALVRMTPGLDAGDEAARDRARSALAANPVPLLLPDHRVRDGPSGAPPDVEQKLRSLEGL